MSVMHGENRLMFDKDLTGTDPIPEAAITRALELMHSGRLFRYGEQGADQLEASLLEQEFAAALGRRYAAAMNSCGSTLFVALKCAGVEPGDQVLINAFTLAPVPGAVAHAGASAVLVEIGDDYKTDLDDLERKAAASGAKVLLLSHMRGHIADMDRVTAICREHGITLIEDCAHTMGAGWDGRPSGTFGLIGCFSAQTFKHINSGEGGLLVTDDAEVAAKAILYSGSYMLYGQHSAGPPAEVFERLKRHIPNFSLRMSNLAAALLRPQLGLIEARGAGWNQRYHWLARRFNAIAHITVPERDPRENFVASSIQFSLTGMTPPQVERFLALSAERGVHIKWFGNREPLGFTSTHEHWRYLPGAEAAIARTDEILACLCDLRIPLALDEDDCATIAAIMAEAMAEACRGS